MRAFLLGLLFSLAFQAQAQVESQQEFVIVGAGAAGLTAAQTLSEKGIQATIYEAARGVGGRIQNGLLGSNQVVVNAGAELVDSDNLELINLLLRLGVKISKRFSVSDRPEYDFLYNGSWLSQSQFMEQVYATNLKALQQMEADYKAVRERKEKSAIFELDLITLEEYLKKIGADETLVRYVRSGVLSELGRDARELSSLVLFDQVKIDTQSRLIHFLPHHDEAWVIEGGSYSFISELERRHKKQIQVKHQLKKVEQLKKGGYKLTFSTPEGVKIVRAKKVIMAMPPNKFNDVEWKVQTPTPELAAQLQYAQNAKVAFTFKKKHWEEGTVLGMGLTKSGVGFQYWDYATPEIATLMFYAESFTGSGKSQEKFIAEVVEALEARYPGIGKDYISAYTFDWLNSYSTADKVGDRTRLYRSIKPEHEGLYFVGEAFSSDFQGYMNGAVETGKKAALSLTSHLQTICYKLFD